MNLQLSDIFQIKSLQAYYDGDKNILHQPVDGVSIDSRTIKENELFFAIKGENFDAHQFIPEVLQKKAFAIVVESNWFKSTKLAGNFIIVNDTLTAFQEISRHYRSKFNIPVLAITGSNGKTTTKEMIAIVLSQSYHVKKNEGNLNNHVGVPITLFKLNDSDDIAIIEIGANHFGEIKRLAEIAQPDYGLITNIGPAHLEFFGSLEGVAKAKAELWDFLETNNGTVFINMDDPFLSKMIPNVKRVITYGFDQKADVQGTYSGSDEFGRPRFMVAKTEIKLQVAGMHNIYNALAAVSVGLEFNLTMNQIQRALSEFLPSAKRMEILHIDGMIIINDSYNSNLSSAKKSLLTLAQVRLKGRRIAVLGDMLELGKLSESHHREVGEFVATLNIDYLLTYGPFSSYTIDSAQQSGLKTAIHFEDKHELIEFLKKLVRRNDVILIKGSRGMAMEEVTAAFQSGSEKYE